mmetsp:Transcript_18208/g.43635  ORF Transcript_18208/g.43635 Transcript_18208/m.43635 type:complete len:464 (-) Transcript_18208:974-2365(-)
MPQRLHAAKAGLGRDALDGQAARLQQPLRLGHALGDQPVARRLTGRLAEAAQQRARAHRRGAGHAVQRPRRGQVGTHLFHQSGEAVRAVARHGPLDELGLAAAAMGWHHQAARHAVGGFHAEVLTHQMQHQIDARRAAGRREHAVRLDIEHAGIDLDGRVALAQPVGVAPVRGRTAAVEQAGGGQHKGARADRRQARAALPGLPEPAGEGVGHRHIGALPAGHHDEVGLLQQPGVARAGHGQPALGAQRAGVDGHAGEAVPARAHLGPRQGEDLGHDGELEEGHAVVDRRHHERPRRAWRDLVDLGHWRQLSRTARAPTMGHLFMEPNMPSAVTAVPAAPAAEAEAHFAAEFRFETDCWDVHDALASGAPDFVLLDVRSPALYARGHVPGALHFPHGKLVESKLAEWPLDTLFVTYCAGPHCNGAARGALRLAKLGRPVKIMAGGITGWLDEGFALAQGPASA